MTKGGLYIPDVARGKPKSGRVLAVGPGMACQHCGLPKEIKVKPGWLVLFPDGAGYEIEVDGKPYLLIRGSDIWSYDDQIVETNEMIK